MFLKEKFERWYAKEITAQLARNVYEIKVNTKLSVIKPIHARWVISL